MGLWRSIKGIGKGIGGAIFGGTGGAYKSPYTQEYEQGAREGIFNRLGATRTANPKYKAGSVKPGEQQYAYNFSETGKPVSTEQANQSYDYAPVNESIEGYRNPGKLTQTYNSNYNPNSYNASHLDYKSLPEEYGNLAYESGAKDIRREGSGNLQSTQQAIGVRRPGLLLKAANDNHRNVGENLANLNAQIRLKEMEKGTDLGVQQQRDQAEEDYRAAGFNDQQARAKADEDFRGYQSRSDLEKGNLDNNFRNAQALENAGIKKIGVQSEITGQERDYQDQALQYLMNLLNPMVGSQNTGAANKTAQRGQTLDFISNLHKV